MSLLPVRWRLVVNLQKKGEWRRQPPGAPEEVSVPEMKKDDLWLFWGVGRVYAHSKNRCFLKHRTFSCVSLRGFLPTLDPEYRGVCELKELCFRVVWR